MRNPALRLDSQGIGQILKSPDMLGAIRTATEGVAARLRGMEPDYPVTTGVITTDRAHGSVSIAHPAGQAVQAKRGSLTKAAAQAGLDVRMSDRVRYTTKSGKVRWATAAQVAAWTKGK